MQTPDAFILEYITDRRVVLERELADFRAFHEKYHSVEGKEGHARIKYLQELLKMTEKVVCVVKVEAETYVICERADDKSGPVLYRYRLAQRYESWLVHSIDMECGRCRGISGNDACGWGRVKGRNQSESLNREVPKSNKVPRSKRWRV
jgi:hypothetical protein